MAIIKSRRQVVQWLAGLLATPWKALGTASAAVFRKRSFTVPLADDDGNLKGSYPASTLYFTEDLGAGVTLEMALIPGGEFRIGSGSNVLIPPLNITEQPVHAVSVNPFVLGVFPVTQEQWRGVAAFPSCNQELGPRARLRGWKTKPGSASLRDFSGSVPSHLYDFESRPAGIRCCRPDEEQSALRCERKRAV